MPDLLLTPSHILSHPGAAPWAVISHENPLADSFSLPDLPAHDPPNPARLVAWSGWFDDSADPRGGLFPRDFRLWTGEGWSALNRAADRLAPILAQRDAMLLLRPHARLVLSDAQGCLTFLRARENQPFRLLLDPASMLTPDMLPRAEDHLARIFDALGDHPSVAAVLIAGAAHPPGRDDQLVTTHPARGLLGAPFISALADKRCPPDLPRVTLPAG